MTTRFTMLCALAGLACLATAGPARADGQVTFGSQWWTQSAPEARFQEYREVPRGGFIESFFFDDSLRRLQYEIFGQNALRRDQATSLRVADGARWWLNLDYRQIPHLFSQIARTAYTETSPGVFRLPDSLQAFLERNPGAYKPTMTDLLNNAHPQRLGFRTDVASARLGVRPVRGWKFEVRGSRRERSGYKAYGGPFGFNSTFEIPEPIQQRTWDGDAIASFVRNRLSVQATGGFSAFQNRLTALRWDNPKRLADITGGSTSNGDGVSQGQIALYPDNQQVRGLLAVGVRLPRRSTFTGTVGLSRTTQNADFLPMTVNTAILAADSLARLAALPARSLDGKATSLTQDYRLTGRPLERVSGTLRFHERHYDNKTPVLTLPGVVTLDQAWTQEELRNNPFGNKQTIYGADLGVEVVRGLSLTGTAEYQLSDRTLREVTRDKETIFELGALAHPLDALELQVKYHHGDRKLDAFDPESYQTAVTPDSFIFSEQPGLRRYDVADRRRDMTDVAVSWALGERVDLSAEYAYALDDYPHSVYGLQRGEERTVSAEAAFHVDPRMDLIGGYGFGQFDTRMRSNVTNTAAPVTADDSTNWTATIKDRNTFVFARAEWRGLPKITLSADYVFSRDLALYDLTGILNVYTTGATAKPRFPAQDLPSPFYRRHTLLFEARYRVKSDTDISARYGFDRLDIHDFASQDIPLLGVSALSATQTAVYLGDNSLSYRAHQLALVATRRF
jgi:MtrB/PioB family decaheme-associated outer membrane protein